jgi:hypothetical protein
LNDWVSWLLYLTAVLVIFSLGVILLWYRQMHSGRTNTTTNCARLSDEALGFQRNGKVREYSALTAEAEAIKAQIDEIEHKAADNAA